MAHTIDLGHCFLRDALLQLQLHFAAKAVVKWPRATGALSFLSNSIPMSQLDSSYWVIEAPQVKLTLLVQLGSGLNAMAYSLIPLVKKGISESDVWSNLGFEITPTESDDLWSHRGSDTGHSLAFFLVKSHRATMGNGRALPDILHNPPDSFPPSEIPTVSLAEIHLVLDYTYCPKAGEGSRIRSSGTSLEKHPGVDISPYEEPSVCMPGFMRCTAMSTRTGPSVRSVGSAHEMLPLLDFALQKLVSGSPEKRQEIKVLGEDTLENLAIRAPVIFKQGYRDAMNQRALSLPLISDAMFSVLGNIAGAMPNGFKSAVETSLWRIAQTGLRKTKVPKAKAIFFPNLKAEHNEDSDMLDVDFNWEDYKLLESFLQSDYESDELLLDSQSEASFEQICESPETSQSNLCLDYAPTEVPSIDSDALLMDGYPPYLGISGNQLSFYPGHEDYMYLSR
ncbi:hypothetical protein N7468_003141 [Penicillium chermesinum]|uniref:Uncharacterized protein n=1 Tax=Penicillium chermesinum TaxID=63820 RepID=A0A9W9TRJ4_9EURO|nr:uncharacterized protein N7468_003141 [Penicillium chermesinum]KAJ5238522.1 hypothetical protein N7468_003141 [Penicillium chermesinum]